MHGRVPRSQETWQYDEGEWAVLGCLRAVCAIRACTRRRLVVMRLDHVPAFPSRWQSWLVMYNIYGVFNRSVQARA